MSLRLGVIQPYVPRYRVPFFDSVAQQLKGHGIELTVLAPDPLDPTQRARRDASTGSWHRRTQGRRWSSLIGPDFYRYSTRADTKRFDAVVAPAAATALDSLREVVSGSRPVALWGHIANYTNDPNRLDVAVEGWMYRRAAQVLAYTESGAAKAISMGVDPNRVTTLNNTLDVSALKEARVAVTAQESEEFKRRYRLHGKTCFSVIGGLDASKRIDSLVGLLRRLERFPDLHFIVAGEGEQRRDLEPAAAKGQVTLLGYADDRTKAHMAYVSEAIVNLGRIGLIAVDALVLQIPIITDRFYAAHAPERDYLREGADVFSLSLDEIVETLPSFRKNPVAMSEAPTIEHFSTQFCSGVMRMM